MGLTALCDAGVAGSAAGRALSRRRLQGVGDGVAVALGSGARPHAQRLVLV
jgi:hypothetical protein